MRCFSGVESWEKNEPSCGSAIMRPMNSSVTAAIASYPPSRRYKLVAGPLWTGGGAAAFPAGADGLGAPAGAAAWPPQATRETVKVIALQDSSRRIGESPARDMFKFHSS